MQILHYIMHNKQIPSLHFDNGHKNGKYEPPYFMISVHLFPFLPVGRFRHRPERRSCFFRPQTIQNTNFPLFYKEKQVFIKFCCFSNQQRKNSENRSIISPGKDTSFRFALKSVSPLLPFFFSIFSNFLSQLPSFHSCTDKFCCE